MRLALFSIALCVLFALFPQIDLTVSHLFYDHGFYLKDLLVAKIIYKATQVVILLTALVLIALFIASLFGKEIVKKRVVIYLLLVLIVGPGLVVNVLFKDHFGRARPSQVVEFGGTKKFTPALIPAHQCQKNCSFSSGHAAAAFYFLAFVPLFRGRKKKLVAAAALAWGSVVGFVRIIQGGHFLSDVICSAVVVYLTSLLLYHLLLKDSNENFGSHTGNE